MNSQLGKHTLLDLYECRSDLLDNVDFVKETLLESVRIGNGTIVSSQFHRFEPHGISGFVVIAESHVSIHTWPEYEFAAIDVFTCGDMDINKMEDFLAEQFKARVHVKVIERRGLMSLLEAYSPNGIIKHKPTPATEDELPF